MDLKEKLVSSFLALEATVDTNDTIHDLRTEAIKSFEAFGFPTKKLEAWKYTSLNNVLKNDFSLFPKSQVSLEYKDVQQYFINEIDSYKIVFVDGIYASNLSETTHDKIDVCLMSSALTQKRFRPVIDVYYNTIAKEDGLTALNTAFAKEGAYIYIPKNEAAPKPIQILHLSTGADNEAMFQPRNLIVAEDNAEVTIIERHQNLSNKEIFTNSVTEIYAGRNAHVDYYKIQNDNSNSSLVDNTFTEQHTNSVCSVHTFSFGGNITRNNLNFYQKGEGIDSILNGVTILEGKAHVDHNTLVEHQEPNCESHQDYKGIFDEKSTGVFNGKIIVDQIAQKTNAFQSNNNILLSDKATVNSKPQLEIFADDVKCSHGCTIGQLDESALFYMRSRGIATKEAKALLMYAFANNILEGVKIPQLKERINNIIAEKLGVNLGFEI